MPPPDLRTRALGWLARREHSRHELQQKLCAQGGTPVEIEALLDELTQSGWLSDARFAEAWVHARSRRYGGRRLAQELRARGVDADTVRDATAMTPEQELQQARTVWAGKFGVVPQDAPARARQTRFMLARGFSMATVRILLQGGGEYGEEDS